MFFDPNSEIDIKTGGNLPHWHQNEKTQFVTFRLADSLPVDVVKDLKIQIAVFESLHPRPWNDDVRREYWKILGPMEERLLDRGYGSCILANKEIRKIVENAILFRDGLDYDVFAFVIMPNHVHLLIQPDKNKKLSEILHSVKRFTALQINRLLNRTGQVWMNESFDRIVRSKEHFYYCLGYIKDNPKMLEANQYELYVCPELNH